MASKKAPKPDPAQQELARAQAENMRQTTALTAEQFAWMKQLAEQERIRGDEQWNFQRGLATEAADRARRLDDRYWSTTARQEDAFYDLVDQFDAPAEGVRRSGQAIADVESSLDVGRGALWRGLSARGINPNSGVMLSSLADMELEGALAKASASTMAHEAAKREGLNLRAMAAGLGGNLQGASGGYLGQASGFGTSALNSGGAGLRGAGAAWDGYTTGMQSAIGWGSSANDTFNSVYAQRKARAQSSGGLGGFLGTVVGTGLGAFAGGWGSAAGAKFGG